LKRLGKVQDDTIYYLIRFETHHTSELEVEK